MRTRQFGLLAALALSISSASAIPIQWTLDNVVWDTGGTATGSFIYDADTNTYSSISIATSGGFGGNTYTDAGLDSFGDTVLDIESSNWPNAVNESRILLIFNDDGLGAGLTNAGGTVELELDGFSNEEWCINVPDCSGAGDRGFREPVSGAVIGTSIVPAPPAALLFGSAAVLLSWIRRRQHG